MPRSKSLFVYFDDDDNVVNIIIICRFKVDLRQRQNKKKPIKAILTVVTETFLFTKDSVSRMTV